MKTNKPCPKLTLKKAKELAVKLIGTSKGIEKENPYRYAIPLGEVCFTVCYDLEYKSLCFIVCHDGRSTKSFYNPDTLEYDFDVSERDHEEYNKTLVERAVYGANTKWKNKLQNILDGEDPDNY